MIRPASKHLAHFALATVVSAVLLTGLLALRLLQGPLSLGIVTPVIEAVLNDTMTNYRVDLEDTVLRWSKEEHRLYFRLKGGRLLDGSGQLLATVPELRVGFSGAALARGHLSPAAVDLFGPAATLERRADGRLQLGFSKPGEDSLSEGSTGFFQGVLTALQKPPGEDTRLGYLSQFNIRDAELTFYDAVSGTMWRAPKGVLALTRTRDGVVASMKAAVAAGDTNFSVTADAILRPAADTFDVALKLADLDPSHLVGSGALFTPLGGVKVPLRGDVSVTLDMAGRVRAGSFWLFAGAGHFVMPGLPSFALDLAMAEVKGSYDAAEGRILIDRLQYKAGPNTGKLTGTAQLERTPEGIVTALDVDVTVADVAMDMPALFSEPGRIDKASIRGRLDPAASRFTITNATLRTGGATVALTGDVVDAPAGLGLALAGTIDNLPVTQFAKLWPLGPGRGARDWIVANIPTGTVRNGVLRIAAKPGDLAGDVLPDDTLSLTFDCEGMEITYLRGLTPLSEARGRAHLTGNRFELTLEEAKIGPLAAREGRYVVPDLSNRDVPATIAMRLTGPADGLLGVLDMPPLGYPSAFGINPADAGGAVDARINLKLPMRRSIRFADVALNATVEAHDFKLPSLYRDIGIEGGTAHFDVSNDKLVARGDLIVVGAPATVSWTETFKPTGRTPSTRLKLAATLDDTARARVGLPLGDTLVGPTPVVLTLEGQARRVGRLVVDIDLGPAAAAVPELNWSKVKGHPAKAHAVLRFPETGQILLEDIVLAGAGLDIKGKAALASDGRLHIAQLSPFKAGPANDAVIEFKRGVDQARIVTVTGAALDIGGAMKRVIDEVKATPDGQQATPLALTAQIKTLRLAHDVVLNDFDVRFSTPGHGIGELALTGTLPKAGIVSARVEPDGNDGRWLKIRSADAGALLAGLDLTANVAGGSLILDAKVPPATPHSGARKGTDPVAGTLVMHDFRVMRAPALAKLLSVGSFGGMRNLLNGEGIAFESLDMPFTMADASLSLGPGRAYGPAVGLTLEGNVPRDTGELDVKGTLVPAYTLNTMLGYVPVFGTLFVSREGEGLIGLTYSMTGDIEDPRVSVNPLSVLGVGFLRRIFQLDESRSADERTGAVPQTKATE